MHYLLAAVLTLSTLTSVSFAAEDAPDYATSTLTGDWGGLRSQWWQQGIALEAGLKIDALHNRGGLARGAQTVSHLELKLRTDLEKIWGWESTVAYVNVDTDSGSGINARRTGSLMGVSNIEVPVPTTRLFHAWVQKSWMEDRLSLLTGIYPIDSEFFAMDSAATLIHPAYGTPGDLALTRTPSVFNNAAFGLRLKWLSPDRTFYAMGALMDGIPNDPARPKATSIRFAKGDGAFVIAELGWMPLELGHAFEPIDPALVRQTPGLTLHEKYGGLSKYAIGFWRYGNRVPDLVEVDANNTPLQRRSQGGYLLAERTLWSFGEDAGRNVSIFARHTFADSDTIPIDKTLNIGTRVRGLLASRANDTLAIGWTRGRLAPKFRSMQASPVTHETALELTWRAEITPFLALQPNYQQIRHPGGNAAAPMAHLLGMRVEVVF
jgi:porin